MARGHQLRHRGNRTQGPQGPQGPAGGSVKVGTEPPGANCANGGANITDATGNEAYACTGATGAQGPQGPQGPAGPSGTSQAYTYIRDYFTSASPPQIAANGSGSQSVGSLSLPAGSYLAWISLYVDNSANFLFQDNHRVIVCSLSPNPHEQQYLYVNGLSSDLSNDAMLSFSTAFYVDHSFTASLDCGTTDGGTDQSYVNIITVRITALAVDNISSQ